MKRNKITTLEEAEEFYKKDCITKGILQIDTNYYRTAKLELDNLLEDTKVLKETIEATLINNAEKMRKKDGKEVHIDMKAIDNAFEKLDREYLAFKLWNIKKYESIRRKQIKNPDYRER